VLGFNRVVGGEEVFRRLVPARIIEPVSKLDGLRVLQEAGGATVSYRPLKRPLPAFAQDSWRQGFAAACTAQRGAPSLA